MSDTDFYGRELAAWLQEAARRRVTRRPLEPIVAAPTSPAPTAAERVRRTYFRHPRELVLTAVAALAYFPYFFADVHVQIATLPHVIVFV